MYQFGATLKRCKVATLRVILLPIIAVPLALGLKQDLHGWEELMMLSAGRRAPSSAFHSQTAE
jgi:hypothetical protein